MKGVYYSDIIIFNGLPQAIKDISRKPNKFKIALKHFLPTHTFYSVDDSVNKQQYFTFIVFILSCHLTLYSYIKILCIYSLSIALLLH